MFSISIWARKWYFDVFASRSCALHRDDMQWCAVQHCLAHMPDENTSKGWIGDVKVTHLDRCRTYPYRYTHTHLHMLKHHNRMSKFDSISFHPIRSDAASDCGLVFVYDFDWDERDWRCIGWSSSSSTRSNFGMHTSTWAISRIENHEGKQQTKRNEWTARKQNTKCWFSATGFSCGVEVIDAIAAVEQNINNHQQGIHSSFFLFSHDFLLLSFRKLCSFKRWVSWCAALPDCHFSNAIYSKVSGCGFFFLSFVAKF